MVNDSCFISFVISQYRVHENTLFWQVDVWAIWNSGVRILPLLTNSHTFSTLSFTGIKVYSALYERTRRKRQPKSIKKASGMIHVTIVSKWKYYYNLRFIIVNGRFFFHFNFNKSIEIYISLRTLYLWKPHCCLNKETGFKIKARRGLVGDSQKKYMYRIVS